MKPVKIKNSTHKKVKNFAKKKGYTIQGVVELFIREGLNKSG
jgi:hypothetical protein